MSRLIALLLLPVLVLQGCAQGAEHALGYETLEISTIIPPGGYEAWTTRGEPGDVLIVKLWVEKGAADFYLTNISGYLAYKDAPPGVPVDFYYVGGEFSSVGVHRIEYLYIIAVRDELVVIADNSNRTAEGTAPTGELMLGGRIELHERFWGTTTILIIAGAVIATLGAMACAVSRWMCSTRSERPGRRIAPLKRRDLSPGRCAVRRTVGAKQRKVLSRKRRMRVR